MEDFASCRNTHRISTRRNHPPIAVSHSVKTQSLNWPEMGSQAHPVSPSPANSSFASSPNVTLQWEGGFFAWKYDVYFGTTQNPPLLTSDVNTGFPGPGTPETFQLATLQPGTTYFWRIVGKTMANMTASSPVWSFTVPGTGT